MVSIVPNVLGIRMCVSVSGSMKTLWTSVSVLVRSRVPVPPKLPRHPPLGNHSLQILLYAQTIEMSFLGLSERDLPHY